MTLHPYALSLLASAVISGTLALYVWLRRGASGGTLFALTMAMVTLWSFGYGLELASTEMIWMRRWVVVEYIGITLVPVLWLLFTLHFSRMGDRLTAWQYAVFFVVPAITVLLNASNERLHLLYYADVHLDTTGPFPLLAITPGPWYWVHAGYSYLCVLGGALVLANLWLHTPSLYRGQATVLVLGACVPLAVNVTYILGIRPFEHIDISPLAFTATGLLITYGIFRYSLFDLNPIARNWLFEDLRDPVLVLDDDGRLVDLNGAARRTLGPAASPGATATLAFARWPALVKLCSELGEAYAEIQLDTTSEGVYDGIVTPLHDRRGLSAGRLVVLRDISERRRAEAERREMERQVQHMQKLESIGVLAGGIAHDFNNLLMAIIGNLDLARFDLPLDHPARESLGDAERAARRAATLTRQLLAYAGKGTVSISAIDLSQLVEEIAQLLQVSVGRLIGFDLRLARDLPAFEGDAAQLQQIVLNLITNASEAIGGRAGTITLATGVCHVEAADLSRSRLSAKPRPGAFVFLTVADTGTGMDPATQERLFEPFFTTKQHGRGLGMSTVLGIIQRHGGAILIESEQRVGTQITVLFPLAPAAAPPEALTTFTSIERVA
jgi:signal transduction histidine kinase